MLSSGLLKLECRECAEQPVSEICSSVGSVSCERSFSSPAETPQVVEPVYNEQSTLGWLRDAPYSSEDGLHTGTRGDLPNETKLTEVKPGFVLTEFPE